MQITGVAKFRNGTLVEEDIPLTVTVLDQNDNDPTFELHTGNITEESKEGITDLNIYFPIGLLLSDGYNQWPLPHFLPPYFLCPSSEHTHL